MNLPVGQNINRVFLKCLPVSILQVRGLTAVLEGLGLVCRCVINFTVWELPSA